MGDPKKAKKKYKKPMMVWDSSRIEEDRKLMQEYGLRNKKEIWKTEAILSEFTKQAKRLTARNDEQGKREEEQLLAKLKRLNLINKSGKLDDVLVLTLKDVMERRLQSIVYKRGLARSIKQARQFVVHGHISISNGKVTVPSYLISGEEEGKVGFTKDSNLASIEHPERVKMKKEERVKTKAKKEEEDIAIIDEVEDGG